MFSSSSLSWLFTVVFTVTGLYSLYRLARLTSGSCEGDRVAELSHLLMSLAMIGMSWAWGGTPSSPGGVLQLVVFGLFAVWFAGRLRIGGHRLAGGYHLVMAVAMVWMVAAMPELMGGVSVGPAMADMLDMAAMSHGGGTAEVGTGPAPGWVVAISVVFIVLLAAAAVWWLIRGVRKPANGARRIDAACHVLMSLGMGGMLLAML